MQPDVSAGQLRSSEWLTRWLDGVPDAWRVALLQLGVVWVAILALTAGDWWVMADKWWNISKPHLVCSVHCRLACLFPSERSCETGAAGMVASVSASRWIAFHLADRFTGRSKHG